MTLCYTQRRGRQQYRTTTDLFTRLVVQLPTALHCRRPLLVPHSHAFTITIIIIIIATASSSDGDWTLIFNDSSRISSDQKLCVLETATNIQLASFVTAGTPPFLIAGESVSSQPTLKDRIDRKCEAIGGSAGSLFFFWCHLLLTRLVCLRSPRFSVLSQTFNFVIFVSQCPLQQLIDLSPSSPSSCFLSFTFPFQQQQIIWTTGPLTRWPAYISYCPQCTLCCFIFFAQIFIRYFVFSTDFLMACKIVKMAVWRVRAGAGFLSLSWMSSAIYAVKGLTDRFLFATKYNNTFRASFHQHQLASFMTAGTPPLLIAGGSVSSQPTLKDRIDRKCEAIGGSDHHWSHHWFIKYLVQNCSLLSHVDALLKLHNVFIFSSNSANSTHKSNRSMQG